MMLAVQSLLSTSKQTLPLWRAIGLCAIKKKNICVVFTVSLRFYSIKKVVEEEVAEDTLSLPVSATRQYAIWDNANHVKINCISMHYLEVVH